MKNFIQNGNTLTLTAPYDVSSGGGLLVNALFGVASASALSGEDVETVLEGVFELPKKTDQQIDQGVKLYWDDTNKELTTTATVVRIRLNGMAG